MSEAPGVWIHPHFTVGVLDRRPDGAYAGMEFEIRSVPGVTAVKGDSIDGLSFEHRFRFVIPAEYPYDLDLGIHAVTPLFHPRISEGTGKACYQVRGELDRVLVDLVANVLMRPDVVRPPSLYKGADWGLDRRKMEWYIEAGPQRVHETLLVHWRAFHRGGPAPSAPRVRSRAKKRSPAAAAEDRSVRFVE